MNWYTIIIGGLLLAALIILVSWHRRRRRCRQNEADAHDQERTNRLSRLLREKKLVVVARMKDGRETTWESEIMDSLIGFGAEVAHISRGEATALWRGTADTGAYQVPLLIITCWTETDENFANPHLFYMDGRLIDPVHGRVVRALAYCSRAESNVLDWTMDDVAEALKHCETAVTTQVH